MEQPKFISIKDFRELGYLQEINRVFLHPLGMALVVSSPELGEEKLLGILDHREDSEGMIFDVKALSDEERAKMIEKAKYVESQWNNRAPVREAALGFVCELIHRDIPEPIMPEQFTPSMADAFNKMKPGAAQNNVDQMGPNDFGIDRALNQINDKIDAMEGMEGMESHTLGNGKTIRVGKKINTDTRKP